MKYNPLNKNGYITRCSLIQTSARGRPHIEPLLTLWTAIKGDNSPLECNKNVSRAPTKGKSAGRKGKWQLTLVLQAENGERRMENCYILNNIPDIYDPHWIPSQWLVKWSVSRAPVAIPFVLKY